MPKSTATIERLRRQASQVRDMAAKEGAKDGRMFVKAGHYMTILGLVDLHRQEWHGDCDTFGDRLWEVLGDESDGYREWVKEHSLPAEPYARAFVGAAVEAWNEIRHEVECA